MNEMKINVLYIAFEMGEAIYALFMFSPVIFINPVLAKLTHVAQVGAIAPTPIVWHFVPRVVAYSLVGRQALNHSLGV